MEALAHLNNVITNKAALVPVSFAHPIQIAALTLGIVLCTGAVTDDGKEIVLYID